VGSDKDYDLGNYYLVLIILNTWFTNTAYRDCFKYLYSMSTLKYCLVNSYPCYYHAFNICLTFPLQNPRRFPTTTILFVWMISLIARCLVTILLILLKYDSPHTLLT